MQLMHPHTLALVLYHSFVSGDASGPDVAAASSKLHRPELYLQLQCSHLRRWQLQQLADAAHTTAGAVLSLTSLVVYFRLSEDPLGQTMPPHVWQTLMALLHALPDLHIELHLQRLEVGAPIYAQLQFLAHLQQQASNEPRMQIDALAGCKDSFFQLIFWQKQLPHACLLFASFSY